MGAKWKITYYETPSGNTPVENFINSLDSRTKSKVINTIDLLEKFGINVGSPHSKKLSGTSIWELRILGRNNLRIFYIGIASQTFLLLNGFIKKKQKTDRREIKITEDRLREYLKRKR
jgi:phage-related protein